MKQRRYISMVVFIAVLMCLLSGCVKDPGQMGTVEPTITVPVEGDALQPSATVSDGVDSSSTENPGAGDPTVSEGVTDVPVLPSEELREQNYVNDNKGHDDLIDDYVIPCIQKHNAGHYTEVHHEDSTASLYWSYGAENWSGALLLQHFTDEQASSRANDYFDSNYESLITNWGKDSVLSGSTEEGVIYLGSKIDSLTAVCCLALGEDYWLECQVSAYGNVEFDATTGWVNAMLYMSGMDQLE